MSWRFAAGIAVTAMAALAACAGADGTAITSSSSMPAPTGSPPTTPTTASPTTPQASSAAPDTTTTSLSAPPTSTTSDSAIVIDGEVFDLDRDRRIPYRVFTPPGVVGTAPVILVSHGGFGSEQGWTRGGHLGSTFAQGGFIAIHVGHLASDRVADQLTDRPADVSFVLDRLADGTITPPNGVVADLSRVGHTGHSFGAYTSHAVGGATFATTATDARVIAIAPISPQGTGQFGAFDNGGGDNTWNSVIIPSYNLIGSDEIDTNAVGTVSTPGWRLQPFDRYPGTRDTFRTIVEDQDHSEMWNSGSKETSAFIADSILEFFEVYVAGDPTADACTIGESRPDLATTQQRAGSVESEIRTCT